MGLTALKGLGCPQKPLGKVAGTIRVVLFNQVVTALVQKTPGQTMWGTVAVPVPKSRTDCPVKMYVAAKRAHEGELALISRFIAVVGVIHPITSDKETGSVIYYLKVEDFSGASLHDMNRLMYVKNLVSL